MKFCNMWVRKEPSSQGRPPENTKVDDEVLETIIEKIQLTQLMKFGRNLGLADEELDEIDYENQANSLSEFRHQIGRKFFQKYGSRATMQKVVEALQKIKRNDLLELILPSGNNPEVTCSWREKCQNEIIPSLQNILIKRYKHLELPVEPLFKDRKFLLFEEVYVDLTLKLKEIYGRHEEKSTIQSQDIFQIIDGNIPKRILIESDPGYGKTTLGLKLPFDWANGKEYIKDKFKLVFNYSLKYFDGDLNKIFLDQIKASRLTDQEKLDIIDFVNQKILLVLDGFDELNDAMKVKLLPLLNGDIYPLMTVILTSRTEEINFNYETDQSDHLSRIGAKSVTTELLSCWDKRIQIKGISQKHKEEFVTNYLAKHARSSYKIYERLITTKSREFYFSPLFLLLFGILVEEKSIERITNRTEFLIKVFNYLVKRALLKNNEVVSEDRIDIFDPEETNATLHRSLLSLFGELALSKLNQNERSFTRDEILRKCNNDQRIFHLGFLIRKMRWENHRMIMRYEVGHEIFLNFLAGFFISKQFNQNIYENRTILNSLQIEKLLYKPNSLLGPFVVGLMKSKAHIFLKTIDENFSISHLSDIHIEMEPTRMNLISIIPFHSVHIINVFVIIFSLNYPLNYSFSLACMLYIVFFFFMHC